MSKEKQNNELVRMYRDLGEIFDEEYEKRRLITPQNTAEKMTAKGYRKQSEGEWIVEESPLLHDKKISCSCCGYSERKGPVWNISWGLHSFCPNCGAKMKGGAE